MSDETAYETDYYECNHEWNDEDMRDMERQRDEALAKLSALQDKVVCLPGTTVTIWVPDDPAAPAAELDAFLGAVADLAMFYEPRTGWDAHFAVDTVEGRSI